MNCKSIIKHNEKETRAGFGEGIYELAQENKDVVVLTADLAGSFKLGPFIKDFKSRFIQCGIAEANMMGVAAGLAIGGKIPYTTTFANFSTGRVYDQIRQSIVYSNKNVKICASHAGLTLGEDGATHQILEDIGLMKMLPGMTVIVPCDFNQTKIATKAIAQINGPVYLRFGRPKWPNFTPEDGSGFQIGKIQKLASGKDATIFACGHLVWKAIEAAQILEEQGFDIEIINVHTIKPIDTQGIIESIRKTKCAVTCEEHNVWGGLGETVSRIAAQHLPIPIECIGTQDTFGESGTPEQLLAKYGLNTPQIIDAVKKVVARKN
ncbi:MAG: transketolase C-terminal domain-containing protein [Alphaproteobacteria bacterium]|nr:transketolase C-terminal domain-containing protein [Alphaproteobacteria bacterium]